jgi:uncharacterized protein
MAALRQPPRVESWGGGGFRIGGEPIAGSALILDDAARPWAPRTLAELDAESFAPVIAAGRAQVEFVVLGTGAQPRPAPRAVRERLAAEGLGLEILSTAEACRLYNALVPEGRRLAAALLAV